MNQTDIRKYGVLEEAQSMSAAAQAAEMIARTGYAVMDGGYTAAQIADFSRAFDGARRAAEDRHGLDRLTRLGEQNTIRALLVTDPLFLSLAANPKVLAVCRQLLGDYFVLNQQNGVLSPPSGAAHTQDAFHRDLPYQHFVSSRPLAISAIFCIDLFTEENGATVLIPGSHRIEQFPSDAAVRALSQAIAAPAGSFIVFDSMLYHRGGTNRTATVRRGINQVYGIPYLRQQIDLPAALGADRAFDADMRRLLGYDIVTPPDAGAYYEARQKRITR